ncbi:MAG: glycoside hydrolase family 3 N-terminal domain-containing protein [Desulfosudaceae bacterium]
MNPADFSDETLAGQRLLAGFEGDEFNDDLRYLIETLRVAGIVLFARNLAGPDDIRRMCARAQACAADCGLPPLIVAMDQEGGTVARLKEPFTLFPGNDNIHEDSQADRFAEITAVELSHVGVNMNLAPVLDVAGGCRRSIMKQRALPGNADQVARLGVRIIAGLQAGGVMAVAKHFPGIGRTTTDSHLDQPELDANPEMLAEVDLLPFKAAIAHDVAGIMLSHIRYTYLDEDFPASLSVRIARHILREQLGFAGVVMTDDLDMGAIARHYSLETAIDRVSRAGIDLALVCGVHPSREKARDAFLSRIKTSAVGRKEAVTSARRILELKKRYLGRQFPG